MSRSLYAKLHRRFGPKLSGSERHRRSLRKRAQLRAQFPELFGPPRQSLPGAAGGLSGATVLVVGAGFAGLSAAYYLSRIAGVTVKVFDGRNRVGGRVWSSDPNLELIAPGRVIEAGAELIGANHPLWLEYAREFGLGLSVLTSEDQFSATGLETPLFMNDQLLTPIQAELLYNDMSTVFGYFNEDAEKVLDPSNPWDSPDVVQFDQMSVSQKLQSLGLDETRDAQLLQAISIQLENNNLLGVGEQSYLGLLCLIKGGAFDGDLMGYWTETEVYRCESGNAQLAESLKAQILANGGEHYPTTTIQTVDVSQSPATVTDSNGQTTQGDFVILAVPPSVMKAAGNTYNTAISVVPELNPPSNYLMSVGPAFKYFTALKSRFWIGGDQAPSGMSDTVGMTWEGTDNQMVTGDQGLVLSVFAGGQYAQNALNNYNNLPAYYGPLLDQIFKGQYTGNAEEGVPVSFTFDHLTLTGYSCPSVGQVCTVGLNLNLPYSVRLFFAGEHTCMAYFGYMEGALQSGVRAAKQIAGLGGGQD